MDLCLIQNEALTLGNIYKEISSLEIKLIEIAQTNLHAFDAP